LDTTFGTGGRADFAFPTTGNDTTAGSVAAQLNGGTLVAGTVATPNETTQLYVTRLDGTGHLDTSFGSGGTAVVTESVENCFPSGGEGCPTAIESGPEGKIYVAACLHHRVSVARLNADGSLDAAFKNRLPTDLVCTVASGRSLQMRLDAQGRLIVMGIIDESNEPPATALVRLNPDGSLDESFGGSGEVLLPFAKVDGFQADAQRGLAVGTDGTIMVGEALREGNNGLGCHYALARVTESGHPDSTFGDAGRVVGPTLTGLCDALALARRPDGGSVLLLYLGRNHDGGPAYYAYGFTKSGELDLGFGEQEGRENVTLAPLSYPVAVVVTGDERTLVAGFQENVEGDLLIARLDANGRPDSTFGNHGLSQGGCSAKYIASGALAVAPDGSLVMAGTLGRQEGSLAPVSGCVARWSGTPK
jgi:uncharacterized delta-60 repeat protein